MGVHTCSCSGLRGGRGGSKGVIRMGENRRIRVVRRPERCVQVGHRVLDTMLRCSDCKQQTRRWGDYRAWNGEGS